MRCVLVAVALLVSTAGLARGSNGRGPKAIEGVVNLNAATSEELQLLPGVGPSKVRNIVAYRNKHPFRTADELARIKGIGRKMVRKLRPYLAVNGPTTARAIKLPPGAAPPPPPPAQAPPRPTKPVRPAAAGRAPVKTPSPVKSPAMAVKPPIPVRSAAVAAKPPAPMRSLAPPQREPLSDSPANQCLPPP